MRKHYIYKLMLSVQLMLIPVIYIYASPEEQFNKANALYRSGNYKDAATSYESLLSGGYSSPGLYYNLGNAHYKSGNIPEAILNYERALRLNPGDEDIQFNLRLANLGTVDKIEPVPRLFYQQWWDNFVSSTTDSGWATAGIIALWVLILFAGIYIFGNTIFLKKAGFFGSMLLLIAGLFLVFTGYLQHSRLTNNRSAIIMEASAYIKSSPEERSTNLFMLHAGTKIDIVDELKGWKKIRIANGNVGWINEKDLETI